MVKAIQSLKCCHRARQLEDDSLNSMKRIEEELIPTIRWCLQGKEGELECVR